MYSHEDRLGAVRLYIQLGKRVAVTIRQLGYPTKNALKSWHREYEQRLDLPAGYVRVPKYSPAQKKRAVAAVSARGGRSDAALGVTCPL
jgi:putative transposase